MDFPFVDEASYASIMGGARAQCVGLLELYGFEFQAVLIGAGLVSASSKALKKRKIGTGRPPVLFPAIFPGLA